MRRSSGRRPAAATGSATDGSTAVAVVVAIERPGGSGIWNEGEQAAGSRLRCKYLRRGVTEASHLSTDKVIPELGGGSPLFQAGENWDINYLFNWPLM